MVMFHINHHFPSFSIIFPWLSHGLPEANPTSEACWKSPPRSQRSPGVSAALVVGSRPMESRSGSRFAHGEDFGIEHGKLGKAASMEVSMGTIWGLHIYICVYVIIYIHIVIYIYIYNIWIFTINSDDMVMIILDVVMTCGSVNGIPFLLVQSPRSDVVNDHVGHLLIGLCLL